MTNLNLTSTGMLATQAGVPHARILKAIDELHLAPNVMLNGVRYFDPRRSNGFRSRRRGRRESGAADQGG